MKEMKSMILQFSGYFTWIMVSLWLGKIMGGTLPKGDTQWLGVLFCLTVGYFLIQVASFHTKLNRMRDLLEETKG